jgi:hypothetical protein
MKEVRQSFRIWTCTRCWRLGALGFGKNDNSVIENVPQMRGRDDIKKAFDVGASAKFLVGLLWRKKK